jgi:hypothetical protein
LGYVARLYAVFGRLLASVRLPTGIGPIPGWQTATLPTPEVDMPNTTYIAAYYTLNGRYADDNKAWGYVDDQRCRPPTYLQAPQQAAGLILTT